MAREPAVAGKFYEETIEKLRKEIRECFLSKYGPGELSTSLSNQKLRGVIVPHAGYFYSGACAAWAYKEIAQTDNPEGYVIIGPNHFGYTSAFSIENWKTPLGTVETHKSLVKELSSKTGIPISESVHQREHSLEVQLPFLQFVKKEIKIVPLIIGQEHNYKEVGAQIKKVSENRNLIFIISSDFTHHGYNYGYIPFKTDIKKNIEKLDMGAIQHILNKDSKKFEEYLTQTGATICGYMPLLIYLSIIKDLDLSGKLLKYYTSGEIVGDFINSVSYASLAFYQKN